jgi:hypothetical protein
MLEICAVWEQLLLGQPRWEIAQMRPRVEERIPIVVRWFLREKVGERHFQKSLGTFDNAVVLDMEPALQ